MAQATPKTWTMEELRAHRDDILEIAARYGAVDVRVFGSVARGQATPDSDVDLLVTMRDDASMFDLVGLWLDLKDLLNSDVTLLTDDEHPRNEHLLQQARQDAVYL